MYSKISDKIGILKGIKMGILKILCAYGKEKVELCFKDQGQF